MKKLLFIPVLIGGAAGTLFASSFETFKSGLKKAASTGEAAYEAGRTKRTELKTKETQKKEAAEASEQPKKESSFDIFKRKAKQYGRTGLAAAQGGLTKYDEKKAKSLEKKQAQKGTDASEEDGE